MLPASFKGDRQLVYISPLLVPFSLNSPQMKGVIGRRSYKGWCKGAMVMVLIREHVI
jgi:hypothetical protein